MSLFYRYISVCLKSFHKSWKFRETQMKFQTFCFLKRFNLSVFDFNDMSGQLWQNLCQCFFPHPVKKCQRKQKKIRCCSMESIIVGGGDKHNELSEKPNNQNEVVVGTTGKLSC